jgi:hypothetical protein
MSADSWPEWDDSDCHAPISEAKLLWIELELYGEIRTVALIRLVEVLLDVAEEARQ